MQAPSLPTQVPEAAEPSNRQKKRFARRDDRGARFHDITDKVKAYVYANSTALRNYLIEQIEASVWYREPKGLDISTRIKEWNATLAILGASYDFSKLDQTNTTAKAALDGAFKKAETLAVQTLFSSLGVFIPEKKKMPKLSAARNSTKTCC